MLGKLASYFSKRTIFLFDFSGALITCLSYVAIYFYFKDDLGFSDYIVFVHLSLAVIYATYSFTMYCVKPKKWDEFLKVIAYANLLFCGVAIKFLISYFDNITTVGKVYLIGEITIVSLVALFELYFIEYKSRNKV